MEQMNEVEMSEVADAPMSVEESEIWEEIMDFVVWEFCIEVHRATKLNYLHLDPALDLRDESERRREEAAEDDPGQKKAEKLACPKCQKKFTVVWLGKHLPRCLGLAAGRDATEKKAQESDAKCGTSGNTGKKRNSSKSSGKDNDIFKNMTYEEINKFLVEKCGVLTTKSKRRCDVNVVKCAQHTPAARELVRQTYSKKPGDHAGNDQMDVCGEKDNLECGLP